MATLTPSDIAYIRMITGDNCGPNYEVSDEMLQYIEDNLASTEPMCLTSIRFGGVIVWSLRMQLAKAAKLFDETNADGIQKTVSQKRTNLKELLEYWESKCGMDGSTITVSTFDLGLDTECDSEYAAYWPYPHALPWSWWGY